MYSNPTDTSQDKWNEHVYKTWYYGTGGQYVMSRVFSFWYQTAVGDAHFIHGQRYQIIDFQPLVIQCCRNPVFWGDTEYYGDLLLCNMPD
jgi:hypothetical protein